MLSERRQAQGLYVMHMISLKSRIGKRIRDGMQPGGRQGLHGEMEHVQLLLKEHGFLMRWWKLRTSLRWQGHIFNVRNAAKSFTLTCHGTSGKWLSPFFPPIHILLFFQSQFKCHLLIKICLDNSTPSSLSLLWVFMFLFHSQSFS